MEFSLDNNNYDDIIIGSNYSHHSGCCQNLGWEILAEIEQGGKKLKDYVALLVFMFVVNLVK